MYVKSGIAVPDTLRWDGRNDLGTVVPDGTYTYRLEAWDDNGNMARSAAGTVVVDNTPPAVRVGAAEPILSPNGDGNKDTLLIEQSGSVEDLWRFTHHRLRRGGEGRLQLGEPGAAELRVERQGRRRRAGPGRGLQLPHQRHRPGGQHGAGPLDGIIINTMSTPIHLAVNPSFFSPNADGVKDTVQIDLDVPVKTGIVQLAAGGPRRGRRGAPRLQRRRRHRHAPSPSTAGTTAGGC